ANSHGAKTTPRLVMSLVLNIAFLPVFRLLVFRLLGPLPSLILRNRYGNCKKSINFSYLKQKRLMALGSLYFSLTERIRPRRRLVRAAAGAPGNLMVVRFYTFVGRLRDFGGGIMPECVAPAGAHTVTPCWRRKPRGGEVKVAANFTDRYGNCKKS